MVEREILSVLVGNHARSYPGNRMNGFFKWLLNEHISQNTAMTTHCSLLINSKLATGLYRVGCVRHSRQPAKHDLSLQNSLQESGYKTLFTDWETEAQRVKCFCLIKVGEWRQPEKAIPAVQTHEVLM